MPEVRAQVAEVTNPADLFPAAQAKPISLTKLFPEVAKIRSYGSGYRIKWLDGNRVHPTLQSDPSQKPTRWLIDDKEYRPTTGDLRIISSFPSSFVFVNAENDNWKQIGNSVPPLFMKAIGSTLAEKLFRREMTELRLKNYGSYAELLDAAWRLHLAPREPGALTVISLFAGCGGSSLGYSMAGYRELLAVDFDERCAETFRLNFPGVPFLVADVRGLTAERLMKEAGLAEPGELDVLDGSPPCQGFSTAGKRDLWDPRNELYREFARLLKETKPKAFIMENVSGMVKGKMKLVFADCTKALKSAGYRVSCRLLDAKWFLVPQVRKRLIWIGIRDF